MNEDQRERKEELDKKSKLNDAEVREYLQLLELEENAEPNELEETIAPGDQEEIDQLGQLFQDDMNLAPVEVMIRSSDSSDNEEIDIEMP